MLKPSQSSKPSSDKTERPWVEKYRPRSLDDVSAQDHTVTVLKKTLQANNLPHMLFYGPPGTGKTSTILALAKELFGPELMRTRVLELNASDERGISIIRDRVKTFARTAVTVPTPQQRAQYPCPPYKIVILDEADSMTQDAQSALRRTMETYSKITRFCLICNYVTRIIDPVASRCSKFRFKALDQTNALQRLKHICQCENVAYQGDEVLQVLLDTAQGDLRKAITLLQSAAKLQTNTRDQDNDVSMDVGLSLETVHEISGTVPELTIDGLLAPCLNNSVIDIKSAVDAAVLDGWSAAQILSQLHDRLIRESKTTLVVALTAKQKNAMSWEMSLADKRLNDGADEHLQIYNLMLQLAKVLKE